VRFSSQSWEPDAAVVNAVAEVSPEWRHGAIRLRSVARIGADYGLSGGEVYRVEADSERGNSLSFVVKREGAQAVERALRFHRAVGLQVGGSVPACLGGLVNSESDTGVLLLEDVAPAVQGDVLARCTHLQALAAVRSLARVHAASWDTIGDSAGGVPHWKARAMASDQWAERLSAAADRFPEILTAPSVDMLRELPRRVEQAIESLQVGPTSWIHGDMHLDNVLFRPDGTAVLLDWSGAVIGPPAVDLVRLLTERVNGDDRDALVSEQISTYAVELAIGEATVMIEDLWDALSNGLALLIQGAVAWAARDENREPRKRLGALRENLLRSVCAWGLPTLPRGACRSPH
jgi:hypothetical protein